jgi:CubicO group peptidase (beta-lactamase class C family)
MDVFNKIRTFVLVLFFLLFQGLAALIFGQAPWPTERWPRSTPEEQQINRKRWDDLVRRIRNENECPHLHSLLIVRNGYLVLEEYFGDFDSETVNALQSVTKSFTSAVMGIAIEQGKIRGVDEKVLDFFPDIRDIQNMDDRKASLKFRDLLTMRSGTDYDEGYPSSPHSQLNRLERGWDLFYLNRPMVSKPGTSFRYDSGGVILMSAMLKSRTGLHVDVFAEKYLFAPLGIKEVRWIKNREGHPHTGGGLYLRPLDMAKFGLLYLRNGKWRDEQVIPAWWIEESFKKHVTFPGRSRRRHTGYGYLWWIQEPDPAGSGGYDIYSARGHGGQFIFIIPEHQMLVVTTSESHHNAGFQKTIDFLYSDILPALHDRINTHLRPRN